MPQKTNYKIYYKTRIIETALWLDLEVLEFLLYKSGTHLIRIDNQIINRDEIVHIERQLEGAQED